MSSKVQSGEAPKIKNPKGLIDGKWASALVSLSLEMQLQLPTRLTMRFAVPTLGQQMPPFPFELGGDVEVSLPKVGPGSTTFEPPCGSLVVTDLGVESEGSGVADYVVVCHDRSYSLTHRSTVNTFADMTLSAIAKQVAGDAGLRVGRVEATSEQVPYLLQTDTDFGFITTLARRCGYDWWVDGEKFYFAPPSSSPTRVVVSVIDDVIRLSVNQSAIPYSKVTVKGWDIDEKKKLDGMKSGSGSMVPPNKIPGIANAKGGPFNKNELSTAAVRPSSAKDAESIAEAILKSQVAAAIDAQGEVGGNPAILPGVIVEVTGDHVGGDYHVTRVEHRYGSSGYITRFTAGDRAPAGIADLLGSSTLGAQFGAYAELPALVPAVVTTIGTGDHLGRVKVTFPYLSDEKSSHWARVLSAGGGPERGFWFLPEVDDEVLVAFENGDPRYPVVMGGLYGKVNTPEADLIKSGMINSRSVRSRLGHFMDFVDGDSDTTRHIALGLGKNGKAGTDYKLRIGEDRFDIEVPEGKPISIKTGTSQITFTDDKSIEITADEISIKAKDDLKLEAKEVTIKGSSKVTISQGGNKVAMASGGLDVQGSPKTTVKGSPKVAIG